MVLVSSLVLAQVETQYTAPGYFNLVLLTLLALGAIGWLVAAVLGFSRARVFGPATRWFALAAVCLVIYHLQLVLTVLAANSNPNLLLSLGAFFPLFIVIGAICAIIGFARLTRQR
jgi:Na+-transporting NADH:ubiquinone oxidoreductase subunit NqrE